MKTIESLGIYWSFESETGCYQDEVDGIIFYGYWKEGFTKEIIDKTGEFEDIWKNAEVEMKPRLWKGSSNCNLSIELWIKRFPENGWENSIYSSLKWFLKYGAILSWCGGEFSSPSLDSFRKNSLSSEVYAAYSQKTGFLCTSDLYDDYSALDDSKLSSIGDVIQSC